MPKAYLVAVPKVTNPDMFANISGFVTFGTATKYAFGILSP